MEISHTFAAFQEYMNFTFFYQKQSGGYEIREIQDSKLVTGSGEHENGLSLINFATFSFWFEVDCSTER